jgi:hypothetical protein
MADNVPITAGSGTNVATDDVAGVHFQRVKLVDGTLDSSTAIPGDATNGLDVDVTRVQGSVTVAQATAGNLNATVVAGSGFPGVATDGSTIISTGTLAMGTDGTNAQTMRMSTAGEQYVFIGGDNGSGGFQTASFDATLTDAESNAVSHLNVHSRGAVWNTTANAGAGGWDRVRGDTTNGMDVDVTRVSGDVTVVQATGSNLNAVVSGTVTANLAAGTNNIGDVDVLSVPAPLNLTGGGTEASALRVTIANNSTGVVAVTDNGTTLSVDDGGGILTVDGTVTANLAAGTNNIGDVDVLTVPAPLNVTGGGTEASALRVTIANDSTGVLSVDDNGTTLSVDDGGGILTVDGTVTVTQATAGNLNATVTAGSGFGIATAAATASTTGPQIMGSDGTLARAIQTTTGGVLKVDGSATTQPVSGTVTVSQATAGNLNATVTGTVAATQSGTWSSRTQDGSGNNLTSAARGTERALSVQIVDGSGTQITSFGGGTQYVEDNASAGGETGTVMLGVRNDAATAKTSADGDFSAFATDSAGRIGIADLGGSITIDGSVSVTGISDIEGGVAHDGVDSGNPVKIGAKAIAHGANPTAVAAADRTDLYSNRHGVLFVIGGHPNTQTIRKTYSSTTATDDPIITVSAGTKIVVTRCSMTMSRANTGDVTARLGFGATTTPTTTGVLMSHPAVAPGSGVVEGNGSGILGVGADGEDVRFTSTTTGTIDVVISYFTIES